MILTLLPMKAHCKQSKATANKVWKKRNCSKKNYLVISPQLLNYFPTITALLHSRPFHIVSGLAYIGCLVVCICTWAHRASVKATRLFLTKKWQYHQPIYMCICVWIWIWIRICICICMYMHMYVWVYIYTYTYIYKDENVPNTITALFFPEW